MSSMIIKKEIRILGVDDCPFKYTQEKSKIVGSVFRGNSSLEGVIIKEIEVDGFDSTEKIISMAKDSRHKKQLKVIMLDGITFAGFNIADLELIAEKTNLGVIAVSRRHPDYEKFKRALSNLPNPEKRLKIAEKAGEVKVFEQEKGNIYFQNKGLSESDARKVIKLSLQRSLIPEPIRTSHMIASAMIKGESKGRV